MSKFDVDQAIRDLEETGKPPDWVTEHLRMYRQSGGTEGHLFDATSPAWPRALPVAHHDRAALRREAHLADVLWHGG